MMRLTGLSLLATGSAIAQGPIIPASIPPAQRGPSPILPSQPAPLQPPGTPNELPPSVLVPPATPTMPATPSAQVVLPRIEGRFRLEPNQLQIRRTAEATQVWQNGMMFRDFGRFDREAEEVVRYLRTSRPNEWATIGSPRPIVEYGLRDGVPMEYNPIPRVSTPIDLVSVRAENIRGAWVMRDDRNILLNFGPQREEAEQAVAVAKKYGFTAIGMIGFPTPVMSYFYQASAPLNPGQNKLDVNAMLNAIAQEQNLARTGIPVPGIGYVGECLKFDARKVELRKDRGEYVLAYGADVLGRFGYNDWVARDALRVIQDCRFTELCTYGGAGVAFFLVNGQAPTRVPYFCQGVRFDPKQLKARNAELGRWGLFEPGGRQILPATNQQECEVLLKILQAYQFDTLCSVGNSPSGGMKFLAKTGTR